jgi:uncharacterized protein YigE (DUF2233 family)
VAQTFEGARFTVCVADLHNTAIELAWADGADVAYRSFAAYRQAHGEARLRFAMNAGMFEPDYGAVGLLKIRGREVTPLQRRDGHGNFYLKPNGVFHFSDDRVGVETTDAFATSHGGKAHSATQSGPMLVIDGALHPSIQADGPSRLIRNGVGVRDAHTAVFVISEDAVSFGKLARFFRDGLGCANALYFDGVVSSLWVPELDREDRGHLMGPMVVVRAR